MAPKRKRFNAARSIVCVETRVRFRTGHRAGCFNAARSIVCVGTETQVVSKFGVACFNAARSIVCVGTRRLISTPKSSSWFQCRTQHCVCRDSPMTGRRIFRSYVSMPHAALCVSGRPADAQDADFFGVSMPHAALCVSGHKPKGLGAFKHIVFQCRTQHCVCRDIRPSRRKFFQ